VKAYIAVGFSNYKKLPKEIEAIQASLTKTIGIGTEARYAKGLGKNLIYIRHMNADFGPE
jgi:hypothetical protein